MDALQFVNEKKQELVQIYVNERQTRNEYGILFIGKPDNNSQAKVLYLSLNEMPPPIRLDILNKIKEKPDTSIIYFYVCSMESAHIVEIDLRDFNQMF